MTGVVTGDQILDAPPPDDYSALYDWQNPQPLYAQPAQPGERPQGRILFGTSDETAVVASAVEAPTRVLTAPEPSMYAISSYTRAVLCVCASLCWAFVTFHLSTPSHD